MSEVPYVPQSPMEIFLIAVLCIISVLVVAYFLIVLYRYTSIKYRKQTNLLIV